MVYTKKSICFSTMLLCVISVGYAQEFAHYDAENNLRRQRTKAYEQWDEKYQDWQNCGCPKNGKYSVIQHIFSKKWVKECEAKRKEIKKIGAQIQEIDNQLKSL